VDRARSVLDERGATAVEYGLMVALVAAVIVAVVALLGQEIVTAFTNFVESVPW
jgi:pilus assembly protein Flp/PilA